MVDLETIRAGSELARIGLPGELFWFRARELI